MKDWTETKNGGFKHVDGGRVIPDADTGNWIPIFPNGEWYPMAYKNIALAMDVAAHSDSAKSRSLK